MQEVALPERITDIKPDDDNDAIYNIRNPWVEITDLADFQRDGCYGTNSYFQLILQKNGKYKLFIKWYRLTRETPIYPFIDINNYDLYLRYFLDALDATFWAPRFHKGLVYFINNDYISPCHQMVCTTLLCNQDFKISLPIMVLIYIMQFLPQIEFRNSKYNHIHKYSEDFSDDDFAFGFGFGFDDDPDNYPDNYSDN